MNNQELLAAAQAAVDRAERVFIQRVGAPPWVRKTPGDFATEVDVAIEELIRGELTSRTGFPVCGEEAGGSLAEDVVWVVDPVDGTANFAAGNPMCAIIVCALRQRQPVAAVISLPLLGQRLTAVKGSALFVNGVERPPLTECDPLVAQVGFGSIVSPVDSRFPTLRRHELLQRLAEQYPRLRVTGSVGVDLAFTALGTFGGVVSFSPHVWDNAAGVLLVRCAGGIATDVDGGKWTPASQGLVAGTPLVHAALLSTMRTLA